MTNERFGISRETVISVHNRRKARTARDVESHINTQLELMARHHRPLYDFIKKQIVLYTPQEAPYKIGAALAYDWIRTQMKEQGISVRISEDDIRRHVSLPKETQAEHFMEYVRGGSEVITSYISGLYSQIEKQELPEITQTYLTFGIIDVWVPLFNVIVNKS